MEFIRALKSYEKALSLDPFSRSVNYNLGNLYMQIERFSAAMVQYRKALQADPGFMPAYEAIGDCFWKLENFRIAVAHYQRVIKAGPVDLNLLLKASFAYMQLKLVLWCLFLSD